MKLPAVLFIFVGFLAIGASFILQLLVTLGVPYIKGIYFLYMDFALNANGANGSVRTKYGIWAQCLTGALNGCTPSGLGYQQTEFGVSTVIDRFFINKMPYALVIQPISAGFTGLAAGAAFLHLCTNTFLWPLAALWASFLTMAALVIELVLFIIARNRANDFQSNQNAGTVPTHSALGPAIWMQVASLPPVFFGFMMLALGWYLKRTADNGGYYDDYEPARPVYAAQPAAYPEKDYYYEQPPQRAMSRASRRSRYDDYYEPEERPYSSVGRRDSRRTSRSAYADDYDRYDYRRSYDDRAPRRSYGGDPYGSRASLAPPTSAAPYRGGRSRRYSERGAY